MILHYIDIMWYYFKLHDIMLYEKNVTIKTIKFFHVILYDIKN